MRALTAFGSCIVGAGVVGLATFGCTESSDSVVVSTGVAPSVGGGPAIGAGGSIVGGSAGGGFGGAAGAGMAQAGSGPSAGRAGSGGASAAGASGAGGMSGSSSGGSSGSSGSSGSEPTLSDGYPGDVGIEADPDVVWAENFEQASLDEFLSRYESHQNDGGMQLDTSTPPESAGRTSLRLTSTATGENATDFYKNLGEGYDELFVRYYARYEANAPWHHAGVWIGGYAPPSDWPNPQAGLKPNGNDRFSVSLEPLENGPTPRLDFYNYWMTMHSWMDEPTGDSAYYGNSLIHEPSLVARDAWQCIELFIKLNPDPSSPAGAELDVWIDDELVRSFTDTTPLGYWIKDKFCPEDTVGTECTDYRPANPELVPLDLRFRSTSELKLNALWPQNYITDDGGGSVWYDDMVLARRRIGCLR